MPGYDASVSQVDFPKQSHRLCPQWAIAGTVDAEIKTPPGGRPELSKVPSFYAWNRIIIIIIIIMKNFNRRNYHVLA